MVARLKSEDIEHLAWILQASDGFTLVFVVVPGPASVEAVLRQIQRESSIPLITKRLDLSKSVIGQLNSLGSKAARAFAIIGLDGFLSASHSDLARTTLYELNWKRNSIARAGVPLVFFLSIGVLQQLANGAPDFFDYRSGVYRSLLAPDPKFWLYDRLTLPPQKRETVEERVDNILAFLGDSMLTANTDVWSLASVEFELAQGLVSLNRLDEALSHHVLGGGLLDSPDSPSTVLDRFARLELRAEYFDKRGEYESAESTLLACRELAADYPSLELMSGVTYRLAKVKWYIGNDDDEVLSVLDELPTNSDPERVQLRAMVNETLRNGVAETVLRDQWKELKGERHALLWISAGYHAARIRVTLGDLSHASSEITMLRVHAVNLLGPLHDAIGFIELLDARVRMLQQDVEGPRIARRGLATVVKVHGLANDSALDAVVQVREMGLDPIQLSRSFLSSGELEMATELWAT